MELDSAVALTDNLIMPLKNHVATILNWIVAIFVCTQASAQFDFLPSIQVAGSGLVATESDYVPNVVFCENGLASFEALKAQAVAARTYAYYKMDHQGFINDGTGDQVYSCNGEPSDIHRAAALATEGEILYVRDNLGVQRDVLIAAFYVAGKIPTGPFNVNAPSAVPNPEDRDPTNTEKWVTHTYIGGDIGGDNLGTPLGFQGIPSNPNWPNRGAKSQNGADFLSDNGIHYMDILKYYYGADIQLRTASTTNTDYAYQEKILTNFDDYGHRFGPSIEGHEGYFHLSPEFSESTSANVAGSTAERNSDESQSGTSSQLVVINYDEASDSDFLLRHLSGARFSDFDGNSNAATRVANLQLESTGSVGFWLKTADAGVVATLAIDDPTTSDRGVGKSVIADNQWHKYQWFLDEPSDWEPWTAVGGNGQVDGDLITLDSIQFIGATDAEIYLDTVFWDPAAAAHATGDFDRDGDYACTDVDLLVTAIANESTGSQFDLTEDGAVDGKDLTAWLAEAGSAELASGNPYQSGDANLDGVTDDRDFNVWRGSRFTSTAAWCSGDFDADGFVDAHDFNLWNDNQSQAGDLFNVPEPNGIPILLVLCTFGRLRRDA